MKCYQTKIELLTDRDLDTIDEQIKIAQSNSQDLKHMILKLLPTATNIKIRLSHSHITEDFDDDQLIQELKQKAGLEHQHTIKLNVDYQDEHISGKFDNDTSITDKIAWKVVHQLPNAISKHLQAVSIYTEMPN